MSPVILTVEGMMCQNNCGSTVQRALSNVEGVDKAEVSFVQKKATVWGSASVADLIDAVEMVGFDAVEATSTSSCAPQELPRPAPSAPKSSRDVSLPVASFSIQGDQSLANLRELKARLASLSGVQFVELIVQAEMVEVSFHDTIIDEQQITKSAVDPFNPSGCRLSHLNTTGSTSANSVANETQYAREAEVSLEVT